MIVSAFPGYVARLKQFIARSCTCPEQPQRPLADSQAFESLALELFYLQFENNQLYRNFCAGRGASPQTVKSTLQIPAVSTSVFKETDLSCIRPEERVAVFHSSGTTSQKPSRHYHNAVSLEVYETSLLAGFQAAAPATSRNCVFLFLTPPPGAVPHSSLVHMFEVLRQAYGASPEGYFAVLDRDNAWVLDLPKLTETLERASHQQSPVFLFGTAFSFVHLLDHLAETQALGLPPGSRLMETGGYKSRSRSLPKSELHSLLTRWLGIPPDAILCEYGMSELSSQAYDSPPDRAFRFSPWARASVVSPETGREVGDGQQGILRILDLANIASVLALETQDVAVRRGNAFELLGRAAAAEPRGCSLMPAA